MYRLLLILTVAITIVLVCCQVRTKRSLLIACKKYDEKITTILMCKAYDDISRERESNRQVQKNKRIKRILVVDDEHDVNLTIRIVLEENGFKVDSFTDASQALENFTAALYDLVILDVKLPGMDGFSLYEKIKKLDDKVIICFLTAADISKSSSRSCFLACMTCSNIIDHPESMND